MRAGLGEKLRIVGHRAEEVGILHQHGRAVVVHGGHQRVHVAHAVALAHGLQFQVQAGHIGAEHDPPDGIHGLVHHQHAPPGGAHGHHGRFEQGRAAVVDRGVGAVHVQQAADGRLEFKNGLECALGAFRLVRRVSGIEFAASGQGVHGLGNLVGIVARAQEGDHFRAVFGGQVLKIGADRGFALPLGQFEAFGPHVLRNVGEKVIQGTHADHGEHFPEVVRRVGNIGHVYSFLNLPCGLPCNVARLLQTVFYKTYPKEPLVNQNDISASLETAPEHFKGICSREALSNENFCSLPRAANCGRREYM